MKLAIQHISTHFMDWLFCKNWILQWIVIFVGVPAFLLALISLMASVVSVFCMLEGLL